ncbi:MAG: hypothetical protein K6G26_02110, partial [Lachnospiraceae bacterium]|nr:hypothetical protein [Lachnospiraceae bacterium]
DKISGIEEVTQNMGSIHKMQEERILKYLELYQNQFLYQKTGYILWHYREQTGLSDAFFEQCKSHIGKSKRYLTKDYKEGYYDKTWKIIVPYGWQNLKNGVMVDADI